MMIQIGSATGILLLFVCFFGGLGCRKEAAAPEQPFVPSSFVVPDTFETDQFRLRMLSVEDVEKDYEAVIESRELLRSLFGGEWPRDGFTVQENLDDLERHQQEFEQREAFAYTVVSLDEARVLGCLYINPTETEDTDAQVHMWVRQSAFDEGLDPVLFQTVKHWMQAVWPFEHVLYPGREAPIAANWCDRLPRPGYAALERVESSDDWFEVYRVAPDVFAIYEPFQWQEVISYLILGSERALLFDTGMGISAISEVVRELTALPITVLNSHTHFDHIGGNAAFTQILAMDTDFTRQRAQGVANEVVREEVSPEALCRPLPEGVDAETFSVAPFEVTAFIEDGHRIDLGDRTLEVLSIPGHTPDAVALLDAESGFLWTGDSFYEGPIWLFVDETDLAAYGRSVERLAALVPQLTRVFPAHNTPVAKPERLVALRDAFVQVQAGMMEGEDRGNGRVEYLFGDFSLLMRSAN